MGSAFRVHEALAAGYSHHACHPSRMARPTTSVRTLEPLGGADEVAAAFALALPDDVVFSHVTAARIWGLPLPRAVRSDHLVHVMRASARPTIIRTGCVHHKGLEHRRIVMRGGLPVTSVEDTWLDLVSAYREELTLADAVMIGDAAVELLRPTRFVDDLHPSSDPASTYWWQDSAATGCRELLRTFHDRPPFRGKGLAGAALACVRPRVWSPMESHSRMAVVESGLPEPRLNPAVYSSSTGRLLGIVDLGWDDEAYAAKVGGEYQGRDGHTEDERSREQDNNRRLALEDEGWKVLEIYAADILQPIRRDRLMARLARWLGLR